MNRSGIVALVVAKDIENFKHRELDAGKTYIKIKREREKESYSLEVKLYDTYGNYIPEDHGIAPYYFAPGILLSVSKKGNALEIERMYIKPEYGKQHIGTAFIKYVETSARSVNTKLLFLEADEETNAKVYWQKKHNFFSPNPQRPSYMEKKLN